ncbi:MAG TPA: polysaccharide biosynthesis C-terminal domain-containing protein, partial [Flavobacteriales bacterium]|nr:polysaccharide biosynthesis C-terminal domain-containing protein [Flavobacteriales bacterium]
LLGLFAMRLIFPFMGVAKTSFITNESLFKFSLLTAIVGAAINVGMNFVLIPTMRANGALWATMISFIVGVFLMDLLFKKTRENFRMMMEATFTFWKIRGSGEAIPVPANRDVP